MFFLVLQYTTISTNLSKTTTKKKNNPTGVPKYKGKTSRGLNSKKKKKKENKSPEFWEKTVFQRKVLKWVLKSLPFKLCNNNRVKSWTFAFAKSSK